MITFLLWLQGAGFILWLAATFFMIQAQKSYLKQAEEFNQLNQRYVRLIAEMESRAQ
jgi:hypothetical protein